MADLFETPSRGGCQGEERAGNVIKGRKSLRRRKDGNVWMKPSQPLSLSHPPLHGQLLLQPWGHRRPLRRPEAALSLPGEGWAQSKSVAKENCPQHSYLSSQILHMLQRGRDQGKEGLCTPPLSFSEAFILSSCLGFNNMSFLEGIPAL